jgi:hypothetical protein
MIGHISPEWLKGFIGWQRINQLHIMMEELTWRDLLHMINTWIQDPEEEIELISDQNIVKRRLDLIDSSTGSHQGEGNSGFINLIDPASDYLPD